MLLYAASLKKCSSPYILCLLENSLLAYTRNNAGGGASAGIIDLNANLQTFRWAQAVAYELNYRRHY